MHYREQRVRVVDHRICELDDRPDGWDMETDAENPAVQQPLQSPGPEAPSADKTMDASGDPVRTDRVADS
jgi:hypothetical protein